MMLLDPSGSLTGAKALQACDAGYFPPTFVLPGVGAKTPSAAIVVRAARLPGAACIDTPAFGLGGWFFGMVLHGWGVGRVSSGTRCGPCFLGGRRLAPHPSF